MGWLGDQIKNFFWPQGFESEQEAAVASASASQTYQSYTPEQLTAGNYDYSNWLTQYANIFNPQGDVTDFSSAYAGTPVATGYTDAKGNIVANPFAAAAPLMGLRNLQFPDLTQNDAMQQQAQTGLADLIQQMQSFQPMTAEQRRAYGEEMSGFAPGSVEGWNQQLGGGIAGMQGISAQEKTLYQRQAMQQIDAMRQENREIIGALSGSGRSIAAFDAMEAATSQIGDYNIQSQLTMIENDFARKQLEYQALKDQRDQVLQMGLEGSQQYEQNLQQAWGTMVSSYATQITSLAQQDQSDIAAFNAHADAFYKQIMADLGVTEAAMDLSSELWAQGHMDELLAQTDELIADILGD